MLEAVFSVSSNTYQYACMHTHLHTEWILSTLLCQWRGTWWDCENAPSGRSYSGHADEGRHCMAGPQNLIHPRRHTHTHLNKCTLRLMAKCCRTMQVPIYVNSDLIVRNSNNLWFLEFTQKIPMSGSCGTCPPTCKNLLQHFFNLSQPQLLQYLHTVWDKRIEV